MPMAPRKNQRDSWPQHHWQRIEEIFSSAADLPEGKRAAFLDAACLGEPDLRHEVDSLLAADRKGGEGIVSAVETEAQALLEPDPTIGTRLGAYRILGEIGRGGMG